MKYLLKLIVITTALGLLGISCADKVEEQTDAQDDDRVEEEVSVEDVQRQMHDNIEAAQARISEQQDEYEQEMSQTMQEWERKITAYQAELGGELQKTSSRAQQDLNTAWILAQIQWQALQDASSDTWQENRASLERALLELEQAWDQAMAEKEETTQ